MARNIILAPILLMFFSGCAMLSDRTEPGPSRQAVETQASSTAAPEKQTEPAISSPDQSTESAKNQSAQERKDPNPEEIRKAQQILKASGFNPGPIDGKLGPQTKSAHEKYYFGCTELSGLGKISNEEKAQQTGGPQAASATDAAQKNLSLGQIRQAQKILKESAFDPGPVDGVLGSQTKAALQKYRSGCVALSDLLGDPAEPTPRQVTMKAPPASKIDKQADIVVIDVSSPTKSGKVESGSATTPVSEDLSKEEIRRIQERLEAAGFDPGRVDGVMGPQTRAALQQQLRKKHEY